MVTDTKRLAKFILDNFSKKPRTAKLQSFLMQAGFPSYQNDIETRAVKEIMLTNMNPSSSKINGGDWVLNDLFLLSNGLRRNIESFYPTLLVKIEEFKNSIPKAGGRFNPPTKTKAVKRPVGRPRTKNPLIIIDKKTGKPKTNEAKTVKTNSLTYKDIKEAEKSKTNTFFAEMLNTAKKNGAKSIEYQGCKINF